MTHYYLSYRIEDNEQVSAKFADENDRDGCDISLGLYRANLGPITREVWQRMLTMFKGEEE